MAWYPITCGNIDLDLCRHMASPGHNGLPHRGRLTHIYASVNKAIADLENGSLPERRQAIIRNKVGMVFIGSLEIILMIFFVDMQQVF